MSDGKRHYEVYSWGWALSISVAGLFGFVSGRLETSIGILIGYWLHRWIDPDLDQIAITSAEGRMMREIPVLGSLLVGWTTLYAWVMKLFGGHRSPITHFPVIGTLVRMVWLFAPVSVLIYYFMPLYFGNFIISLLWVGLGLGVGDLLHFIEDYKIFRRDSNE
jgi:hypothetical protein